MSPDPATDMLSFSVDLPLGTYDVVASSQGFVPDTATDRELINSGDSLEVNLEL
jgi:hypothetical protein